MLFKPTVRDFYENGLKIAIIDNTDINRRKVILVDKEPAYKQVFFLKCSDYDLVKNTIQMRKLNIPSF